MMADFCLFHHKLSGVVLLFLGSSGEIHIKNHCGLWGLDHSVTVITYTFAYTVMWSCVSASYRVCSPDSLEHGLDLTVCGSAPHPHSHWKGCTGQWHWSWSLDSRSHLHSYIGRDHVVDEGLDLLPPGHLVLVGEDGGRQGQVIDEADCPVGK